MEEDPCLESNPERLDLSCEDIPSFVWRIAEKELGETEVKRKKCLKELRDLIKAETDLEANCSTNFLLRFLRVRKFIVPAAFKLLKYYYKHRQKYPHVYLNYSPSHYQHVMAENMITFLPTRTQEGCAIYAVRLGLWNVEKVPFEDLLKFGLLCHEKVLENPVTQICGVTSIIDMKDLSWSHLRHLPLTSLRCFVSATQDCFPIRHKAIHIINNRSIFELLFFILKPLIKPDMRKRIHFHGTDLPSLHQHIPSHSLPVEFGGTFGTFFNEGLYTSLLESEEFFTKNLKYGYRRKSGDSD